MESNRRRFQANAKPPERKQSFGARLFLGLQVNNMRQFKLTCCGAILSKIPHACYSCGATTFLAEELDKEEQVITMGSFSGDKQKETRPWGSFEVLVDERGYKVKKIIVNKTGKLSLQLHTKRNEYWHILEGHGEMQLGNRDWVVSSGDCRRNR